MGDTSIRLTEEAKRRLELHKKEGDSYDDVIMRLTERDPWAGFGALSDTDTDTRNGMDALRNDIRNRMADDIESP